MCEFVSRSLSSVACGKIAGTNDPTINVKHAVYAKMSAIGLHGLSGMNK